MNTDLTFLLDLVTNHNDGIIEILLIGEERIKEYKILSCDYDSTVTLAPRDNDKHEAITVHFETIRYCTSTLTTVGNRERFEYFG